MSEKVVQVARIGGEGGGGGGDLNRALPERKHFVSQENVPNGNGESHKRKPQFLHFSNRR